MIPSKQLLMAFGLITFAGTAVGAPQSIDFSANLTPFSLGGLGSGQTFFPEDVAGYSGQTTLDLVELSFWSGNLGGTGHATTYIAIYDGNPDTASLVGSSTNFVDTSAAAAIPNYTELQWTFASLNLIASTEYWAVMSNSPMDINPTNTVPRSLQEYDHQGAPNDAYRGTSIIANREPHSTSIDLRFKATFSIGLGMNYCGPAVANSAGLSGVISASGSASAAANDVTLDATDLPPNQFGYFLNSMTQASTFPVPGSQGVLCLGGSIGRYNSTIFNSGTGGTGSLVLDLANTPTPTGTTSIVAGETWNWSCWYRDNNPGPTSNFTDAISITFQ